MLEVVEIIRTTVQGMTRPTLCLASDGNQYVVKGKEAGNDGLVKEYICGYLGQGFNLPIPKFRLIIFPDELLAFDSELQRRFSGGPCFASKYESHLQEFDRTSQIDKHAQLFKDLYLFDFWIKNDDRNFTLENGGNPNLLVDTGREQIYVIDHNLAFDTGFDLKLFKQLHVGCKFWHQEQLELFDKQTYQERMNKALDKLDDIIDGIPEEWLVNEFGEVDFVPTLKQELKQFSTEEFWSDLK